MGNILLLFLVLFPMLLSAWVFPLRRRDRRYRNWLIRIIPAVELAAALLLLLWPGAALELPGVALTVQPVTQVAGGDIFTLPPGKRAVVDGECHLDRRIGDLDERQRLRFPGGADRAADGQI